MHTQISFRFWLLVVATILGIAACTAKLQRSVQQDQVMASSTPKIAQSAKANEKIDTTLTLEKLRWKNSPYSVLKGEYYLDTAITNHLPHFNAQELLTYYRFLFDLGKDDSVYCPKCNDTLAIKYKGGHNYEYYYYYKGIPVSGYIGLQTGYGNDKIYQVRVSYERLKDFDVTPQMSIKEATEKAIQELRFEQSLARVEKGGWNYYTGVDTPYYSGLSISLNKLYHNFIWHRNWSMMVEDKTGITLVYDKTGHNRLCDACDFSTATYTTQTVPTYSNANFNYGNVLLEVQECAYTLGDNMLKRYRLQQNANPFHFAYLSGITDYANVDYEEADWYSVPNLSPIDPAITVQDIKTVNGVISATVTGLANATVSPLTNNAITPKPNTTYTNGCSNTVAIAVGSTSVPVGMSVTADPINKTGTTTFFVGSFAKTDYYVSYLGTEIAFLLIFFFSVA